MSASRLLLIGCGAMGSAMLRGWLKTSDFQEGVWVVSPHRDKVEPFLHDARVRYFSEPTQISGTFDVIICALKPTLMASVLPAYEAFINASTIFMSVAAGKPLQAYISLLGHEGSIVRVMPNLPSAIGQGISLVVSERPLTPSQSVQVLMCLTPLGDVAFLENEDMLDRAATLTGCGPAYVFRLVEALAHGAYTLGLSKDQSLSFAKKLVVGSAQYMADSDVTPTQLRVNVTSPGGMTQAALKILEEDGALDELFSKALKAAYDRSQEMK